MTRFIAFLALCWAAFTAYGGSLLIITEATARNHAGVLFLLGACAFKAFL